MLNKDRWVLGIVIGLVLPAALFGILYLLNRYLSIEYNNGRMYLRISTLMLIAIFTNMFTLRYYLVKKKFDKTGRGILMVTFVFAFVFFYFFF
jgi:hypothetical protein